MKHFLATMMIGLIGTHVCASLYFDTVGDINDGSTGDNFSGFPWLDLTSVNVSSDTANIYFSISAVANPIQGVNPPNDDWGNYAIGIDSKPGGDDAGNAWFRPISMLGMDYWIGSWVDGGGGHQFWSYNGTWNQDPGGQRSVSLEGGILGISIPMADLGVQIGDTITFDVYSTGSGPDGAIDALSSPGVTITTWGGAFDTGDNGLLYVVPEPSVVTLLGVFGLGAALVFIRKRQQA